MTSGPFPCLTNCDNGAGTNITKYFNSLDFYYIVNCHGNTTQHKCEHFRMIQLQCPRSGIRICVMTNVLYKLTHWGRVTHIYASNWTIIGSDNGSSPGRHQPIIQCWNIFNWTFRNKLPWNFNRNSNLLIQENALENVVREMASILSRPQCVNVTLYHATLYRIVCKTHIFMHHSPISLTALNQNQFWLEKMCFESGSPLCMLCNCISW